MQVSSLTVEEFKSLIQETVTETIESILMDPDAGRQLRPELEEWLRDSLQRIQAGGRGIPAVEVAAKLGLDWNDL